MRIFAILSLILLLSPAAEAAELAGKAVRIKASNVNVRQGPGLEHPVVGKVHEGNVIPLKGQQEDWYQIEWKDGSEGWIRTDFGELSLKLPTSSSPEEVPAEDDEEAEEEEDMMAPAQTVPDLPTEPSLLAATPTPVPSVVISAPTPEPVVTAAPAFEAPPMEAEPAAKKPSPRAEMTLGKTSSREFKELSLGVRPGFAKAGTRPTGMDDSGFSIDVPLSYFLHPYIALQIPYSYQRFSSSVDLHRIGGGFVVRYLDYGPVRGAIDASTEYVRAFNGNHMGWSAGADLTIGAKKAYWKPFIGPFFRYNYTFLSGQDLASYTIGVGLTLTDLADLD